MAKFETSEIDGLWFQDMPRQLSKEVMGWSETEQDQPGESIPSRGSIF
jgi:hypothetical protein